MIKRLPYYFRLFFLLLLLLAVLAYAFLGRIWVSEVYEGSATPWLMEMADAIYPRLQVERHRFPLSFFLDKADQLIWRAAIWSLLLLGLGYLSTLPTCKSFWASSVSSNKAWRLHQLWLLLVLLATHEWGMDLQKLTAAEAFFRPVFPLSIYMDRYPAADALQWMWLCYLGLGLLQFWRKWAWQANLLFVILYFWQFACLQSFEKIDHAYASMSYALLFWPFLLWEHKKGNHEDQVVAAWPIWASQIAISLCYFQSGMEKILVGGLSWLGPAAFEAHIAMQGTDFAHWLVNWGFSTFLPTITLVFQLSWLIAPFNPKHRWIWLFSGILFHWGTIWLIGVGAYRSPWIMAYLWFWLGNNHIVKEKNGNDSCRSNE